MNINRLPHLLIALLIVCCSTSAFSNSNEKHVMPFAKLCRIFFIARGNPDRQHTQSSLGKEADPSEQVTDDINKLTNYFVTTSQGPDTIAGINSLDLITYDKVSEKLQEAIVWLDGPLGREFAERAKGVPDLAKEIGVLVTYIQMAPPSFAAADLILAGFDLVKTKGIIPYLRIDIAMGAIRSALVSRDDVFKVCVAEFIQASDAKIDKNLSALGIDSPNYFSGIAGGFRRRKFKAGFLFATDVLKIMLLDPKKYLTAAIRIHSTPMREQIITFAMQVKDLQGHCEIDPVRENNRVHGLQATRALATNMIASYVD